MLSPGRMSRPQKFMTRESSVRADFGFRGVH
jgi:hypothetical protein